MAKEQIKVKIDREGKIEIMVDSVKGKACTDITKDLEVHLGEVSSKEYTADYYKKEDPGKKNWLNEK